LEPSRGETGDQRRERPNNEDGGGDKGTTRKNKSSLRRSVRDSKEPEEGDLMKIFDETGEKLLIRGSKDQRESSQMTKQEAANKKTNGAS